jgi:hypothetical protein
VRLKPSAAFRERFPEATQCRVDTHETPLSNKFHRRQITNPHGIRTAVVKFNKLLRAFTTIRSPPFGMIARLSGASV